MLSDAICYRLVTKTGSKPKAVNIVLVLTFSQKVPTFNKPGKNIMKTL